MRLRGSETVLAVDDDPSLLGVLQEMLIPQGYKVFIAGSGEEALEIADSQPEKIDLLLTDVLLPGIKGQDLAKELQSRCPDMNVLFMSGYLCPSMAHNNTEKNFEAFIQKPFSFNSLLRKIRNLLD
jgi:two-component system cell cycle sensor histidine kinase/response regulator CckA